MHDAGRPADLIKNMAAQVAAQKLSKPVLIGIHSGGVWVAEQLRAGISPAPEFGTLDISFYRDDFSRVGLNPQVKASDLPPVDRRDIILVDDVLHTGRTIRAALNEIFSYGRPERICLAVLIERPGRELPIQPDVAGKSLALSANEEVKLSNDGGELSLDVVKI
ncbi:MAG: bifunctional pyr operon transcriptional regulator/uracil phosphoribosyltransferase PyrR [Gammaproteobacteria bacterium]|nr:bifunctional pyr operon transcriptional regulator/uracil phosphoribosyltransferase PyrR [Gammaproteobacteria bacterium]MDA7971781.1 bifunctional pyr operon transcriptional regulator/uracil phosphoribosyltransferase PyrR [Gammaproteobacteria bacterium]MDA7995991.1 bifunctional pyr operon transcriptional regulator/uracil phosphoribosyltransferase PyrR [Gammaproteobacteria bacterium]CAJ2376578.1 MAG: Pyrimidine operon regulatory protein / Uracil phosphoribosyltransferase [Arenicellales bacterium